MNTPEPLGRTLLETWENIPLGWKAAGALGIVALLLLAGLALTPGPARNTAQPTPVIAPRPDRGAEAIVELVRKETDLSACRNLLQQLNAQRQRQSGQTAAGLPADDLPFLQQELYLDNDELQEITSPTYTPLDAHHLEMGFLLSQAARALPVAGQAERVRAAAAFAWVVRQVRLEEAQEPLFPVQAVLRRGWGTDQQRAFIFLALLDQLNIPGGMVGVAGRAWLPCAYCDGDVYLFDTRLGAPLPGLAGQMPATLAQVRSRPEILQQLTPFGYDVTPEQVKQLEIYLACPLSALAPRMQYLEKLLGPAHAVRLWTEPRALKQRWRPALDRAELKDIPIRFWNAPRTVSTPTRALRAFLPPEEGGSDASRTIQRRFNGYLIPWQALPQPVEQIPEEVELGSRLRTLFATPFLDFMLRPRMPLDLIHRGRLEEAVSLLVETLETTRQQAPLRGSAEAEKAFVGWLQEVRKAQEDVLLAQRRAKAENTVETQAALKVSQDYLKDSWKKGQKPLAFLEACAAGPLAVQASYLLALAKHEQAELAQAQQQRQTAQTEPDEVRKTWESARDRWHQYLADYPGSPAEAAARMNLARVFQALSDQDAALTQLEPVPAHIQGWNRRALALRAQLLKARGRPTVGLAP